MGDDTLRPVLAGQKALVIGVANDDSIAYGCAKAFHATGADLAITWLNEKARPYVEPLARELGASITGAVDVAVPGQLEARRKAAGIVFGARVPIILTSRANSLISRLASCAVAVMVAAARRKSAPAAIR